MQEKDMVIDILTGTKASVGSYAKLITECNDQRLRQTFQQMRDGDEKFQYDLYKIAEQKGYYVPAPEASTDQRTSIKQTLNQGMGQSMGTSPSPGAGHRPGML